jgi:polyphosphate kinase
MSDNYKHRDISWLDFNYRVLQEAKDKNVPLLERIKFLAIYSSNLDEFFRVRVASLRSLVRAGGTKGTRYDLDYDPVNLLPQILKIVNEQQVEFSNIFDKEILPDLKRNNIFILRRDKLSKEQMTFIENYFKDFMLPYAQPVLLIGNKVKPFLNNNALYLALHLKDRETEKTFYGIVKVPSDHLPRFMVLPSKSPERNELIIMGDVVRHNISMIFPGFDILDSYSIKLTRDAELYIDDEFSGNLLDKIKKSLNRRNIGQASRLVYDRNMPDHMLEYLKSVFELSELDLLPEGRYHNNADFFKFPSFGNNHLKDNPLPPLKIDELEDADNIFDKIRDNDYFIHLPYHSYETVIKFFEDAAVDPTVTHIKIIQYRVAKVSRIMEALKLAVENGKQVTTFIEVKARFDEETNLMWGEVLAKAGVTVYYSMPGYKVHSKMAIVRRFEGTTSRIYAYLSTGNFHENTAKLYSDVGIFTSDPRITNEATRVFTFLETKKKVDQPFENLGVGLFNLKDKLIGLVNREIDNAKAGKKAKIILKMNNLEQKDMIDLLYKASQAGVEILLIVRSVCSLVAGVPGLSDNIKAISIVDRFLEHSRIFYFFNEGDDEIFISSADWMERNLHFRVETLVPIYDEYIKDIFKTLLTIQASDNVKSRSLNANEINNYISSDFDLAVRSQVETYYFIKRKTELHKEYVNRKLKEASKNKAVNTKLETAPVKKSAKVVKPVKSAVTKTTVKKVSASVKIEPASKKTAVVGKTKGSIASVNKTKVSSTPANKTKASTAAAPKKAAVKKVVTTKKVTKK